MKMLQSRLSLNTAHLRISQTSSPSSRCCRAITQASRQAAPAELTTMTFSAQDATKEKLSLRVADPTASRGLVHRHVVLIQQNARQGSANTKTRAEVRGGGRKPFKQKGTGNARQGSRTSPLKPGGGVIFGPKPKDWTIKMNKKERRLAIATALQSAAAAITVVDDITSNITEVKTRLLVDALDNLGADVEKEHVLLVLMEVTEALIKSGRNIPKLKWNKATALNTYDVLRADRIVMDKASLDFINSFYGAKSEPPATADPTPPPASKEI